MRVYPYLPPKLHDERQTKHPSSSSSSLSQSKRKAIKIPLLNLSNVRHLCTTTSDEAEEEEGSEEREEEEEERDKENSCSSASSFSGGVPLGTGERAYSLSICSLSRHPKKWADGPSSSPPFVYCVDDEVRNPRERRVGDANCRKIEKKEEEEREEEEDLSLRSSSLDKISTEREDTPHVFPRHLSSSLLLSAVPPSSSSSSSQPHSDSVRLASSQLKNDLLFYRKNISHSSSLPLPSLSSSSPSNDRDFRRSNGEKSTSSTSYRVVRQPYLLPENDKHPVSQKNGLGLSASSLSSQARRLRAKEKEGESFWRERGRRAREIEGDRYHNGRMKKNVSFSSVYTPEKNTCEENQVDVSMDTLAVTRPSPPPRTPSSCRHTYQKSFEKFLHESSSQVKTSLPSRQAQGAASRPISSSSFSPYVWMKSGAFCRGVDEGEDGGGLRDQETQGMRGRRPLRYEEGEGRRRVQSLSSIGDSQQSPYLMIGRSFVSLSHYRTQDDASFNEEEEGERRRRRGGGGMSIACYSSKMQVFFPLPSSLGMKYTMGADQAGRWRRFRRGGREEDQEKGRTGRGDGDDEEAYYVSTHAVLPHRRRGYSSPPSSLCLREGRGKKPVRYMLPCREVHVLRDGKRRRQEKEERREKDREMKMKEDEGERQSTVVSLAEEETEWREEEGEQQDSWRRETDWQEEGEEGEKINKEEENEEGEVDEDRRDVKDRRLFLSQSHHTRLLPDKRGNTESPHSTLSYHPYDPSSSSPPSPSLSHSLLIPGFVFESRGGRQRGQLASVQGKTKKKGEDELGGVYCEEEKRPIKRPSRYPPLSSSSSDAFSSSLLGRGGREEREKEKRKGEEEQDWVDRWIGPSQGGRRKVRDDQGVRYHVLASFFPSLEQTERRKFGRHPLSFSSSLNESRRREEGRGRDVASHDNRDGGIDSTMMMMIRTKTMKNNNRLSFVPALRGGGNAEGVEQKHPPNCMIDRSEAERSSSGRRCLSSREEQRTDKEREEGGGYDQERCGGLALPSTLSFPSSSPLPESTNRPYFFSSRQLTYTPSSSSSSASF
ncbi:hypothetical protein CSUI_007926, partial [Cystoisospora suis]